MRYTNKLGQIYLTYSAGIKICALIIMALYKSLWNTQSLHVSGDIFLIKYINLTNIAIVFHVVVISFETQLRSH